MNDPNEPISRTEMAIFGSDCHRHAVLGFIVEQGSGSLPVDEQAENFCRTVDETQGRAAGNAMRRKCGLFVAEDAAAAKAVVERAAADKAKAAFDALEAKPELEAKLAAAEGELASVKQLVTH